MKRLFILFLLSSAAFAQTGTHSNTISWTGITGAGATYNVYKDHGCTGTFAKANTSPLAVLTYVDGSLVDGELNCYTVTATLPGIAESPVGGAGVLRVLSPTYTPPKAVTPSPGSVTVAGN